jgi:hypothetical protein
MERFRGDHNAMVPPYAERFTGFTGYDYINSHLPPRGGRIREKIRGQGAAP